jgi:SAM-dependent methyltransferase
MLDSTQRFSNRVDFYVRARPKYPAELLRFFQQQLQLAATDPVADIGSGTGLLTKLFVENGNPTFAVEPNGPMRKAGEAHLGQWPNFHSVNGTAETTTLADASVRFITAAQAFHWFDVESAAREFRRILQSGGVVALIWNERVNNASAFMADYDRLIQHFKRPGEQSRLSSWDESGLQSIGRFFGGSGYQLQKFNNPQRLNKAALLDRIHSSSYMPLPGDPAYTELAKAADALFETHQADQTVCIDHETHLYYGTLASQ